MMFAVALALTFAVASGRLISLEQMLDETLQEKLGVSKDVFCSNPVSKEKVVFSDKLAGRGNIDFDMYSGYVNVTTAPDYLFYWFFSTRDKNPNAPLIIWTNGNVIH